MVRFLYLYNIRQQKKLPVSNLQKAQKQTNYTKNLINRTIHLHIRKKSSNFAADITYIY